ncbi:lipase 3-like [Tenebrio molitor]|uniref:lipase 3-like n=1 Tax=Tenebrio molitor TaxID=7067 RepID=UPI001C3B7C87|nr:unnamed protein product [Tenebrio molitor]
MKSAGSVVVVLAVVCAVDGANFWEFLVGPRLGNGTEEAAAERGLTEQIVKTYGYRLDTHLVASETGHILTLHRIPRGRKWLDDAKRPVAFIHHGLFGCSDMWLLRGPQFDLPYILADSGYDVWLFNTRGNVYSRRHKFLDPDKDATYWDFGIEEMGNYDLPVTIDYILNITNQQNLYFLGHSIGSSAGFISCSLRPEYNKKIRLFLALGPLANVRHTLNPLHKIIFSMGSALVQFIESMDIHEVLPRREYASKLVKMACEDGSPLQKLCLMTIFSIVGDDFGELDTTTFPRFVRFYPAGTSLKVVANVIQYYLSGEFARGDFGSAEANRVHYNSSTPPLFDLSKVTAPVSLHYGPGDLLVTQDDVDDLSKRLPNVVGKFKISHKHFNHLDFVLAVNARCLLYDSLLRVMRKYR